MYDDFPNNEKRVKDTMCSGVFLTNFKVFGNVVKHCLSCLIIFSIAAKTKTKMEK